MFCARSTLIAPLCLVLLGSCNTTQKNCTHALGVFEKVGQQHIDDALATVAVDQRGELEKRAAEEMGHLRASFVDTCTAADPETLACIARIDELQAIEQERRAAKAMCPKGEFDLPDLECLKKAGDTAKQKAGACGDKLKALMDRVHAPNQ